MKTQQETGWYSITNIDMIDTPALVVYPERVRNNIEEAVHMTDGPSRLRPHVKTHKTIEGAQLMMNAGIDKFKCATIAEAEMLAMAKAPDVLLAYQPIGPKADRLLELIKQYPATVFSCLVDHPDIVNQLGAKAVKAGITLPVYIDINAGMNRTGIDPGPEAVSLYELAAATNGLVVYGWHVYDGHIRDTDLEERTRRCNESFEKIQWLNEQLEQQGLPKPKIIAGGSPTFPIHAKRKEAECSPGTFIYWDQGYGTSLPEQPFIPAAVVITRIISLPAPDLICTDLGHKSIAAENELGRRVYFINAPEAVPVSQSEEHLVLRVGEEHSFCVGEVLYGIPYHICPTCALYDQALTVVNNEAAGEWSIVGRKRKINY